RQPEVRHLRLEIRSTKFEIRNRVRRASYFGFRISCFEFSRQQNVGGFEVAVDDAAGVGVLDGPGEGGDEFGRGARGEGLAAEARGQAPAAGELQGQIW